MTILRSLIRQCLPRADSLLEPQRAYLARFLAHESSALEPVDTTISELLVTALSRVQLNYVVIDGFDACPLVEQCAVLEVLDGILAAPSVSRLKVYFASRDDVGNDMLRAFSSRYHVSVSRRHVDADIAAYVEETMHSKIRQCELLVGDPEIFGEVQRALVDGANGMSVLHSHRYNFYSHSIADEIS